MAHYLDTIRGYACDELEKLAQKGKIADRGDAQLIDWLTHTVKSIDTIEAMAEEYEGGYSERGHSYRWYPNYEDMDRYSEARKRDSRGRYSRDGRDGYDDGRSYRGYSRDGDTMEHLHRMLDEAKTEQEREQIRRWISEAEKR